MVENNPSLTTQEHMRLDSRASLQLPGASARESMQSTALGTLHSVHDHDDDYKMEDDIVINFEDPHLDNTQLSHEQLMERCDVLESMLEAEKAVNESYKYSQQVIIDHLAETNEGLLQYFRVKFQVLGDGGKKKKKKSKK